MGIGFQSQLTGATINSNLGQNAVDTEKNMQENVRFWNEVIVPLGANEAAQVTALQGAPFNMSPTDAQNFWTAANELFAVSQIYYGNQTQPAVFNYSAGTAAARAAQ